jgi:hypothetical protein
VFAVLQSAGAGGAGLAVVNGVVGVGATAVAVGATAPGLVHAAMEGKNHNEEDGKDGKGDEEKMLNGEVRQEFACDEDNDTKSKL